MPSFFGSSLILSYRRFPVVHAYHLLLAGMWQSCQGDVGLPTPGCLQSLSELSSSGAKAFRLCSHLEWAQGGLPRVREGKRGGRVTIGLAACSSPLTPAGYSLYTQSTLEPCSPVPPLGCDFSFRVVLFAFVFLDISHNPPWFINLLFMLLSNPFCCF